MDAAGGLGRVTHDLLQSRFPKRWIELEASSATGKGSWEGELIHTAEGRPRDRVASPGGASSQCGIARGHVLQMNRDITERKAGPSSNRPRCATS